MSWVNERMIKIRWWSMPISTQSKQPRWWEFHTFHSFLDQFSNITQSITQSITLRIMHIWVDLLINLDTFYMQRQSFILQLLRQHSLSTISDHFHSSFDDYRELSTISVIIHSLTIFKYPTFFNDDINSQSMSNFPPLKQLPTSLQQVSKVIKENIQLSMMIFNDSSFQQSGDIL